MKVGERRKAVSEPIFQLKEPIPAFAMVQSTDEDVVALDPRGGHSAWVVAKRPGRAMLKYYPFDFQNTTATTVHVISKK
jgi:hypothetical protein